MSRAWLTASMALLSFGCASAPPKEPVRVVVMEVNSIGGAMVEMEGKTDPVVDESGVRAVMESELLRLGVTVVDAAEFKSVLARYGDSLVTGVRTTATEIPGYEPAATHGVVVRVRGETGLLTALSLGLLPRSVDVTARVIDLRTGEVVESVCRGSLGSVYSSRGAFRAARKAAGDIARRLRAVRAEGRHLRSEDWVAGGGRR